MRTTAKLIMKHMMHSARDIPTEYDIDLIKRTIVINVPWVDTLLLDCFLSFHVINIINRKLEEVNKLPLATNIKGYSVELIVDGKAHFDVRRVERDFETSQPTLVMKVKEL